MPGEVPDEAGFGTVDSTGDGWWAAAGDGRCAGPRWLFRHVAGRLGRRERNLLPQRCVALRL